MGNVDLRLEHMDQSGVNIQVLHNTIFIESATDRAAVEVALCKSWNRWLADIWRRGKGRLRWSCMAPTMRMHSRSSSFLMARASIMGVMPSVHVIFAS